MFEFDLKYLQLYPHLHPTVSQSISAIIKYGCFLGFSFLSQGFCIPETRFLARTTDSDSPKRYILVYILFLYKILRAAYVVIAEALCLDLSDLSLNTCK